MKDFKYKIIEMDYVSMHYENGDIKTEVCKTLHKTNWKIIFFILILYFKIKGIKYEVVND